jgi:hypothetical protein
LIDINTDLFHEAVLPQLIGSQHTGTIINTGIPDGKDALDIEYNDITALSANVAREFPIYPDIGIFACKAAETLREQVRTVLEEDGVNRFGPKSHLDSDALVGFSLSVCRVEKELLPEVSH